jgi:DNA-binding transcriptional LysR family regulator
MHKSGMIELEVVVAVARRGSFRAAALDLGMSPTAVGNAVAGLEARLGVRLFNRTTRSVSLSAAGSEFVAKVTPALSDIQAAMETVNNLRDTPRGLLRINCSISGARQILVPVVLDYLTRYPDMQVELVADKRLVDIVAEGFDAGIRLADAIPRDMIAIPLGVALTFAVVGSPAYFAHHPRPGTPGDLLAHRCIRARMSDGSIFRWEFDRDGETLEIDVQGPLILNETELMLDAALAGAGLTYLPEWGVADALADGRLVRVLADWTPPLPGLSLYYPGRRHLPAGLRAFIDMVRQAGGRGG